VVLCCGSGELVIGGGADGGGGPGGRCEPEFESYGDTDTVCYAVCVCVFVCDAKSYREWHRVRNSVTQSYGLLDRDRDRLRNRHRNQYKHSYRHRNRHTYRQRYRL
jgi:hypothetical protein